VNDLPQFGSLFLALSRGGLTKPISPTFARSPAVLHLLTSLWQSNAVRQQQKTAFELVLNGEALVVRFFPNSETTPLTSGFPRRSPRSPKDRLCNDHVVPVESRCGRAIELIPQRQRVRNPMAESSVIHSGKKTIAWQAVRRLRRHSCAPKFDVRHCDSEALPEYKCQSSPPEYIGSPL